MRTVLFSGNYFVWLSILITTWYLCMTLLAFDGYFRQLMGHSHHHSRVHYLIWQFHTGQHIHPMRSYGDERRLTKTASASNRATPEGAIVYYAKRSRAMRALIRNACVWAVFATFLGLIFNATMTVQAMTSVLITLIFGLGILLILKWRKAWVAAGPHEVKMTPWAKFRKPSVDGSRGTLVSPANPERVYVSGGSADGAKPSLDRAIPVPVMAQLLAGEIGVSAAEAATRIRIGADRGVLQLPDHFPALTRQREVIQEIIQAQTSVKLGFDWQTSSVPRTLSWVPVISTLPTRVLFRDHLEALGKMPAGVFGLGLTLQRKLYATDHGGDTPWHLRSCGSGTGKSTGFQVKVAQICVNDPTADIYCFDTKQVSFASMHGIPGVHIFDDPVEGMDKMWNAWYMLASMMRDRYTAVRLGQRRKDSYNNVWVLVDEGNDMAGQLKLYYERAVKKSGDPAQPKVWSEAIAPLIYQGREVGVRGEMMFQNMTDKVLGGVSLRDAFGVVGMAGFKRNQWSRIIGTTPIPECKNGPGKILMVDGPNHTWVQGFYDDPTYLHDYALAGRSARR